MSDAAPARCHPLLIALHWLIALPVFMALPARTFLEDLPNDATKIGPLDNHMLIGISVLALMLIRLVSHDRSRSRQLLFNFEKAGTLLNHPFHYVFLRRIGE